jgi:tetratricopeptide (TPR) repeat protein/predicted MPP superfamily phosphohydrolase
MHLRYLHISDLHLTGQAGEGEGWAAEQFNQDAVTRRMLEAISALPPPDLIFLSGDLARRGKPDEYRVVEVFLQRLLEKTGVPVERLFLVPGNHDVDRGQVDDRHVDWWYRFDTQDKIAGTLGYPDAFRALMRKFAAFREFAGRALGREVYTERETFFGGPVVVPKGDSQVVVNVLGLNSALFAGYDGDDKPKLAFGLPQVNAALQKLDTNALLTVAFFHHPFECFHPADRVCKNLLVQKADLILSGHLHEPDNAFLRGAAGQAVLVSAGASFETRDSENSFNVVEIDLETGRGQVQFYKYLPAFHRWKKDTDVNPDHPEGLFPFTIERLAIRAEARAREAATTETALPILGRHVISYSPLDGAELAERLYDALRAAGLPAWLDRHDVVDPGPSPDVQVEEALKSCASLSLVVTRSSITRDCDCARQWHHALSYKRPIVPLIFETGARPPLHLANRHAVDFATAGDAGAFDLAVAHLHRHLDWLATPEGTLQQLRDRLADAEFDLRFARSEVEQARIHKEMGELQKQIADQMRLVENPQQAAKRTEQSIAAGLERERQPEKPLAARTGTKFINPPPMTAPAYFQDRTVELGLLAGFLGDEACRLVTVVGRAGVGKTAMVCLLLKALESGRLPDLGSAELNGQVFGNEHTLPVDGIVYLSAVGTRRVNLPNLWADLVKLLPPAAAAELEAVYQNPQAGTAARMLALLAHFPRGRVAVLLDNFEELLDAESGALADTELDEALRALLAGPQHGIKVLITTRLAPRELQLAEPGRQKRLELGKGLESPHAENVLRVMDADGTVGLKPAPDDLLDQARQRTRGYPRALEALYAILSADRHTSLAELLAQAEDYLPENVVEALVGQAFSRLDEAARQVMQALAVYDRPVRPAAVDYLLQPYRPGADSAPLLNRLVAMHFARKVGARYHLHPVDRAYAFARIPEGEPSDRKKAANLNRAGRIPEYPIPNTRFALLHRAAEYYCQARLPRAEWKTLGDLAPQLAEFELRCAGGEYDTAAEVLLEIDWDYLYLWGHYGLMITLHEQLLGKCSFSLFASRNLARLGGAYEETGQYQKAISCCEQALAGTLQSLRR